MKDNKRRIIKKRLHEIDAKKNYSGEASPYWDAVAQHQDIVNRDMKTQEDPLANPDVLSEEDAIHHRPLTVEGTLQMEAVYEVIRELTPKQREILRLAKDGVWVDGELGHTEQAIADALNISRSAVHTTIHRLKAKIRQRYEKLKAAKE